MKPILNKPIVIRLDKEQAERLDLILYHTIEHHNRIIESLTGNKPMLSPTVQEAVQSNSAAIWSLKNIRSEISGALLSTLVLSEDEARTVLSKEYPTRTKHIEEFFDAVKLMHGENFWALGFLLRSELLSTFAGFVLNQPLQDD